MSPARFLELIDNPAFIPGIFDYCDRRCEYCPLSHRCLNYALMVEEGREKLENADFMDRVHPVFEAARKLMCAVFDQGGSVLPDKLSAALEQQEARMQAGHKDALTKLAMRYARRLEKWLVRSEALFEAKGDELAHEESLGIGQPFAEAKEIEELYDTIVWFQHFIAVKVAQAHLSRGKEALARRFGIRGLPSDSNGFMKIALIAMDRSLAAWSGLLGFFPEQEDTFLEFQALLARLRREAQRRFPDARSFVLPGFDEPGAAILPKRRSAKTR